MTIEALVLNVNLLPVRVCLQRVHSVEDTDSGEELTGLISVELSVTVEVSTVKDLLSSGGPLRFVHVSIDGLDAVALSLLGTGLLEPVLLHDDILAFREGGDAADR